MNPTQSCAPVVVIKSSGLLRLQDDSKRPQALITSHEPRACLPKGEESAGPLAHDHFVGTRDGAGDPAPSRSVEHQQRTTHAPARGRKVGRSWPKFTI